MKLLTLAQAKDELSYQKTDLAFFKQLLENSICEDDITFIKARYQLLLNKSGI
ncbi:hypothetical protein [Campylobacter hyointestinalis]|uniref:hypothetical protein n=1 Tax=Campylobacter hyointestinalis TaxID=198 RepID=UPI00164ED97E|nr:hypothetical protein [Campylobacter hyointestinalis]